MILGINEEKFLTQEDDYKGGFDYSETFYCPYLNFCTEKAPSKQPGLVNGIMFTLAFSYFCST